MTTTISTGSHRNHQFDFLRILFATLVLFSHASELTDGNRSREWLSHLTQSDITFGVLSVDGFFLLSGFLILKSWLRSPKPLDYLSKRFLRIAPGYTVATLATTVVGGLFYPGVSHFFQHLDWHFVRSLLFIFRPSGPLVFPLNPYPGLNGSLWTILYEFRCYMFVLVLGLLGWLGRPRYWLVLTGILSVLLLLPKVVLNLPWPRLFYLLLGDPASLLRLAFVFFLGGCFLFCRVYVRFRPVYGIAAAIVLLSIRLVARPQREFVLVLFGSYLLFYFTTRHITWLSWMDKVPDISYGVYLYGWPVESLLIARFHWEPVLTFFVATVVCYLCGWISWTLVEGPALLLIKRKKYRAGNLEGVAYLPAPAD